MADGNVRRVEEFVGERVRIARNDRGWKQTELVEKLQKLGFTQWYQSKVAKIEKGEVKRLALDDVLALAAALGVQLAHLLSPEEGEVELAPEVKLEAPAFRAWFRGYRPLSLADEKSYYMGALAPPDEYRPVLQAFFVEANAKQGGENA